MKRFVAVLYLIFVAALASAQAPAAAKLKVATTLTVQRLPGPGGNGVVTIPRDFFGETQLSLSNPHFASLIPAGVLRLWDTSCVWKNINTSAGVFTWSSTCDALLSYAASFGMIPDFVFGVTPIWATAGGAGTNADPPSDVDTTNAIVSAMATAVVTHFAAQMPGVHPRIECVNEANRSAMWTGTMSQLVKYCTAVRTAVHAIDPLIVVLGPSGDSINTSNVHLYSDSNDYAHQTGAAASMDAINIHPYSESCTVWCTNPENILASLTQVTALTTPGQPLAGLPVYFSEGSYGGGGLPASLTDAQLRQFLTREYMYFIWQIRGDSTTTTVKGFYWYAYDSHPDNPSVGFGTECKGTPPSTCTSIQAATAHATLINWLAGATFAPPSTTAMSKDGNGTWTMNLLSSPASSGSAEIIFNATATPSVSVPSAYTKVINWDGTTTPIVAHAVTAGPDPVMAVP